MFDKILKVQFEEVMNSLVGREVSLKFYSDIINISAGYNDFKFNVLENGRYQFSNPHDDTQTVLIKAEQIDEIHRDRVAPTMNSEEIFLYMKDGSEIFIWSEL